MQVYFCTLSACFGGCAVRHVFTASPTSSSNKITHRTFCCSFVRYFTAAWRPEIAVATVRRNPLLRAGMLDTRCFTDNVARFSGRRAAPGRS